MSEKYRPLQEHLRRCPSDEPVALRFADIAAMVGGLPPSSRRRTWWANSVNAQRRQARAWMGAGRRVQDVNLANDTVMFSVAEQAGQPATRAAGGLPPILDGVGALMGVVRRAGYRTLEHLLASATVFLDPATVEQTGREALFPVTREPSKRGTIGMLGGRRVLFDDNTSPTLAFLWSARRAKGPDVQFNHIWGDSRNVDTYTALWNLCVTPAFLAKTTDGSNNPGVVELLKCRSYELFGHLPEGERLPSRPAGYAELEWAPSPPVVDDLEVELRSRLAAAPRSRPARAAREIGWLFSGRVPDRSFGEEPAG